MISGHDLYNEGGYVHSIETSTTPRLDGLCHEAFVLLIPTLLSLGMVEVGHVQADHCLCILLLPISGKLTLVKIAHLVWPRAGTTSPWSSQLTFHVRQIICLRCLFERCDGDCASNPLSIKQIHLILK